MPVFEHVILKRGGVTNMIYIPQSGFSGVRMFWEPLLQCMQGLHTSSVYHCAIRFKQDTAYHKGL